MTPLSALTPQQQTLLMLFGDNQQLELDPVRVMKGAFIVTMEVPEAWIPKEDRYTFEPYNYGPYSRQVYADLATLEDAGLIASHTARGRSWKIYTVTPSGTEVSSVLATRLPVGLRQYFSTVRDFVKNKTFEQLLNAVYKRYPEYAVNSVFR